MKGSSSHGVLLARFKKVALSSTLALLVACGETAADLDAGRHMERAQAYESQGQYKAAIIEYKNALRKSGGDAAPMAAYVEMLNELGHYPSSLALLDSVEGELPQALMLAKIDALMGMGKMRSAERMIASASGLSAAEKSLLEARVAMHEGRLAIAEKAFRSLQQDSEVGSRARVSLAALLAQNGAFDEAASVLNTVAADDDSYARAQLLLAGVKIAKNELEQAESILTDLLSKLPNTDIMRPERASALERLSYVLTRLGRSNEAYIYTKLLAEAYPGANEVNEQYSAALQSFKDGDLAAARAILTDITAQYPSYDKANQLLGIISYLQGETELASEILAGSVDPEIADPLTTHIYAASQLKLNDPRKVLEILEPGIEASEAAQTWVLYGLAAISDAQHEKAERAFKRAVELAPEDVRVRLALASFYESSPKADRRKQWAQLEAALAIAPTDRQVLQQIVSYQLQHKGEAAARSFIDEQAQKHASAYAPKLVAGYFHASQNRLTDALGYFDAASAVREEGDDYLNAMFAKGKVELALSQHAAAEQTYATLAARFPESAPVYRGLYSTYLRQSGPDIAREKLEALGDKTKTGAPYQVLVESALASQNLSAARKYFKRVDALSKDAVVTARLAKAIQYSDAVVAMQQGDIGQSRAHIVALLKEEPNNLRLLSFLVDLDIKAGALKEARKVVAQVEAINPAHPVVATLKGDIALAANDLEGAEGYYQAAWNKQANDLSGEKLFRVLSQQKKETAKGRHLQEWLSKLPNSVPGLLYQSMRWQQRGQRIKAKEGYERLLGLAPDNIAALNNLGWIYHEENQAEDALKLLERAAQLAPNNAAVLDSYGWVLFKHGDKTRGVEYLRKANKLAPDNKEIAAHLKEAEAS